MVAGFCAAALSLGGLTGASGGIMSLAAHSPGAAALSVSSVAKAASSPDGPPWG